jgi:alpha,alpha-trehalase
MRNRNLLIFLTLVLFSCSTKEAQKIPVDFYSSELFREVQLNRIFPDSKTFVDCTPKKAIGLILEDYAKQKKEANFNLKGFVENNFNMPVRPTTGYKSDSTLTMEQHISRLWPELTRKADQQTSNSSLIPLPGKYIVPGGRFSEVYYWDSYFTMLGLQVQNRYDLIGAMVANFAFLIDSIGFIPNANRNYYLSRSQPPFFSMMVNLLAVQDSSVIQQYLPQLQKEYAFWMDGEKQLRNPGDAYNHVVKLPDGSVLNRYYDNRPEPRPEAFKEDSELAERAKRDPVDLYRDIRAAAESGWDFSSRWFADGKDIATIQTTKLIPVDLNCLLYHHELMIAKALNQKGQSAEAIVMKNKADARRKAILANCWDQETGFFYDFNFKTNKRADIKTLAGSYPMFFNIVSSDQASQIDKVLRKDFLKQGGLVTTFTHTGQQWDSPNGWAPLQWMAYKGLRNYGHDELAGEIRKRWVRQNERVYQSTGKMMEKYNVMDTTLVAGGGEYKNQDGFGWTNGIALAMKADAQVIKKR